MEKHTENKLLHKTIDRISHRYRHEKVLSSFKEKKLRYLSMDEDEFLLNYIEISMECIYKKWMLFFSSMVWMMMTISLLSYVKKLLTVLPTISDQAHLPDLCVHQAISTDERKNDHGRGKKISTIAHAKRKEEAYMAKWLKGMAYLSAFDPDRKGKKIRHRTNVMIVIGLIINIVATPMLFS